MSINISEINDKVRQSSEWTQLLRAQIAKSIVGQKYLVDRMIEGVLANGHILLEGVPGLAKTLAIKTLAAASDAAFSRIQFTPDLLPSDIVGTLVFNQQKGEFFTQKGPVFANFVLADEINRAPAKVQSALLEAMQERQVSIGGSTYPLPSPFLVLATQNPIDQEGTYQLPEAQVDRFMFKLLMRYPTVEEMKQIVLMTQKTMDEVAEGVVDGAELLRMRETAKEIPVTDDIVMYTMRLVSSTQPGSPEAGDTAAKMIRLGASPRAAQALITGAKVRAMVMGRYNVSYEDINALAGPVLRHRIKLSYEAMAERITPDEVIEKLVSEMKQGKKRR